MTDESKIRDAADAVKGVLDSQLYEDAVQPGAKQVGMALETVGKAVNVALAPLKILVWGIERIEDWLGPAMEERLANVPPERIVTPKPTVAGPALEALRYAASEESLRDLYANLLATAMDRETAHMAHPAFVEILKQLTPDEAKLLGYIAQAPSPKLAFINVKARTVPTEDQPRGGSSLMFAHFSVLGEEAGCAYPDLTTSYLDNLERLGVLSSEDGNYWSGEEGEVAYAALEQHQRVRELWTLIDALDGREPEIEQGLLRITTLGSQFIAACVVDRSVSAVAPSGETGVDGEQEAVGEGGDARDG